MRWGLAFALSAGVVAAAVAQDASSAADLLARGRADEAIQQLTFAIKSSPQDAELHHLLTRAYYRMELWDDAVKAAEQAVKLNPNDGRYRLWLGRAYGEKASHAGAFTGMRLAGRVRQSFEKAVELSPGNLDARSDLAEFYFEAPGIVGGGRDKALRQADEIAKLDAATALWVRARVAEKRDDFQQADKLLRQAITASGNRAASWLDLASFYRRQGRKDEMEKSISSALSAGQVSAKTRYDAAVILLRAERNFPLAERLLREYIESGQHREDAPLYKAHYLLGTLLEKNGDRKQAAEQYAAALKLASRYRPARAALDGLR